MMFCSNNITFGSRGRYSRLILLCRVFVRCCWRRWYREAISITLLVLFVFLSHCDGSFTKEMLVVSETTDASCSWSMVCINDGIHNERPKRSKGWSLRRPIRLGLGFFTAGLPACGLRTTQQVMEYVSYHTVLLSFFFITFHHKYGFTSLPSNCCFAIHVVGCCIKSAWDFLRHVKTADLMDWQQHHISIAPTAKRCCWLQ